MGVGAHPYLTSLTPGGSLLWYSAMLNGPASPWSLKGLPAPAAWPANPAMLGESATPATSCPGPSPASLKSVSELPGSSRNGK